MTEIPTSPWKVKIYENVDNVWTDRGTGFCIGQIVQSQVSDTGDDDNGRSRTLSPSGITASSETASSGSLSLSTLEANEIPVSHEAFLTVYAENSHDELILKTRVFGDIHYHKQQDSLIVWSEPNDSEMCLSFQEAKGCSTLCDFLIFVQNNFEHDISVLAIKSIDNGSDETVTELLAGPLTFPPDPAISNLGDVIDALNNSASTQYNRDAIVKYIHDSDFISKLVRIFSVAEDLHSLPDLHNLCRIMKMFCKCSPQFQRSVIKILTSSQS
ncbi:Psy2p [Sugiyamaella lignohabitans]|uniref:Psy2p n=1 Tax=Sugiyamaella lignohabitans TaxID=796027 RepID=A0A167E466_9ASCO|nr:Psy2p [Sugiyamaella lignohabitans]ANB13621.1 Psy2p [Sugiyamaella lignohabitans]